MKNTRTRILVVDDHPLVRAGLKSLLHEEEDFVVSDEASTAEEAIDLIRRKDFDVVVLDVSLPGRNGLDVVAEVRKSRPRTRFLFLTMHPEDRFATRALKAGGSGYVTKGAPPQELVRAIRKVARGGVYVTNEFAERIALNIREPGSKQPHERLSEREFQIFIMLASGKKSGHIARELSITGGTVYAYRGRILQKMALRTNTELTRYAIQNRLIE